MAAVSERERSEAAAREREPLTPEQEAKILFPDAELEINGEKITVREFGFIEASKLQRTAEPIIEALARLGMDADNVKTEDFANAVADNIEAFTILIAKACDKPVEWVEGLSDQDGNLLSAAFWEVNSGFFVRRLLSVMMRLREREQAKK